MKIPVGQFGYRVATVERHKSPLPAEAFETGSGLAALGKSLMNITLDMMQEDAKAKAIEAHAGMQSDAQDLTDGIERQMESGEITRDQVEDKFNAGIEDIKKKRLEGVAQAYRPSLEAGFVGTEGRARRTVKKVVETNIKQERLGAINNTLESLQRIGLTDPDRAISQAEMVLDSEGPGVMGADKVEATKQSFRERAMSSHYTDKLLKSANDPQQLEALSENIGTDVRLDPDKRNVLLGQAQRLKESREHKLLIESERRARENEKLWDQYQNLVDAGKHVDPTFATTLAERFRGTVYAPMLEHSIKSGAGSTAFAVQPVTKQSQVLSAFLAKGNDPQQGWTPAEQKNYEHLSKIHAKTLEDIKRDPLTAAAERGVIQAVPPIGVNDLAALPAILQERSRLADTTALWAGREVSPLRPEEAQALAGLIEALPADRRASALGGVARTIGNPSRMRALAAQMGSKTPTLAIAAVYAARDLRTASDRPVAELILRGEDMVKQDRAFIDKTRETGVRAKIYEEIGNAYATTSARDAAAHAAFLIYAAQKAEGRDSMRQAVEIATGGLISWNGVKTVKPYGWADGEFRDAVRNVKPQDIERLAGASEVLVGNSPMTAAELTKQLPRAPLLSVGDGEYAVQAGAHLVRRADGQPLRIRLERRNAR